MSLSNNTPSPTRSTTKANSYLLARRQERRKNCPTSHPQDEEKDGAESASTTEIETQPKDSSAIESPSSPGASTTRRQEQAEKAYRHLTKRRAKQRQCKLAAAAELQQGGPTPSNHGHPVLESSQEMTDLQRLILLVSNGVSDRTQASNQARARTLLLSKSTPFVEVDGMDPNQKERRNELFEISGIRASYPQFFLERKDGTTAFLGTWDLIEEINDNSSYPDENIEAHPELKTWDRVFANVVLSFD